MPFCDKCEKEIEQKGDELIGGFQLNYKDGDKEYTVFRCEECYGKDKSLTNYQPCEVYSRIVGYLRPVKQWNKGKKEEYKDRINYKNENL